MTDDVAPGEVLLFEDEDGGLLVRGDAAAVDAALAQLLAPADLEKRRSTAHLAPDAASAAAGAAALVATTQEYLRPTAESLEKMRRNVPQFKDGALRGYVKDGAGHFAGDLFFEKVTFGPEQALALQTLAVSMALRTAIANVEAAVDRVDAKVSDLQRHLKAQDVGDIVGTYRHLDSLVTAAADQGYLIGADWDDIASAGRDLKRWLEKLRTYATLTVHAIEVGDRLPKREAAVKALSDPHGMAGLLQLILIGEQALHLWEYLRLERVREAEPDRVDAALTTARHTLRDQRALDETLVAAAVTHLEKVRTIRPFEIHHLLSIPDMEIASNRAFDALQDFAQAARAPVPDIARDLHRPALSDARAEAKRKAGDVKDVVVIVAHEAGQVSVRGARSATARVRRSRPRPPG